MGRIYSENLLQEPDEMIRKIIGKNKIKYHIMTEILDKENTKKLKSLLINGDSILLDLHDYLSNFNKKDSNIFMNDIIYSISSSIINIIAHYRYYFLNYDEYPNIYFCADINDEHEYIKKAMEITKIILKYVPCAYFVDTTNLTTGIVMKYFMSNKRNLIITRDEFDLMLIDKNTTVIKANKDKSKAYGYDTWQQSMFNDKYKPEFEIVSYKFLNMIECFSGTRNRIGVKGLGNRSIVKLISKGLKNGYIEDMVYSNINDFISDMKNIISKYDASNAIYNFETYDINSNYPTIITKAVSKRLDNNIEDKFSKKDLIMLNTKYFTGLNYLMLDELMMVPKSFKNKHEKW